MIDTYKCNICGNDKTFFLKESGPHFGIYCNICRTWHKWLKQVDIPELYVNGNITRIYDEKNNEISIEKAVAKRLKSYENIYSYQIENISQEELNKLNTTILNGKEHKLRLEIELVPKSCWYNNLRNVFTKSEWEDVSDSVRDYNITNGKCAICGGKPDISIPDNKYLEAHEVWEYIILDDNNGIIKLKDILPLCSYCHKSKHYGLSQLKGWTNIVNQHLKAVNNITDLELYDYLRQVNDIYIYRSSIQNWKLDLTKLKELGFNNLYEKYKNIGGENNE